LKPVNGQSKARCLGLYGAVSDIIENEQLLASVHGCKSLSIGVIGEHAALLRWYARLGFVTGDIWQSVHLPFSVTYMRLAVPTLDGAIS